MRRRLSFLIRFLPIACSVLGLAAWYSSRRLCAPLEAGSPWRPAIQVALGLVWAFPLARILSMGRLKAEGLWHVGFYLLGLAATFLLCMLAVDLAALVLGLFSLSIPLQTPWFLGAICFLMSLWGLKTAFALPGIVHIPIPHQALHPELKGLRIAQVSDLHISNMVGKAFVQQVVEAVMAQNPDLIAITGDLVDGPVEDLREAIKPLGLLRAPLGVFYVTGNHEYIWGAQAWVEEFKALGFEVLDNAHRLLRHGQAKLLVIGINDLSAERMGSEDRPDVDQALRGAPEADFRLFLAHQPQAWRSAQTAKADLMLAGHTHAGQFFPFQGIVSLFHRYFKGLYRHEDEFWVYINAGSGFWGPPNRLWVPTEITILELKPA
jgi:predicted MPP superfamily phosphohydrolase